MIYTTIIHEIRKNLKISCNDYCVIELIRFRQNDPNTKKIGWCTLTRQEMADELDFSRQTIITILNKAKELGLIEEDEKSYLKISTKWFEALSGVKTLDEEANEAVKKLDLSRNFTANQQTSKNNAVKNLYSEKPQNTDNQSQNSEAVKNLYMSRNFTADEQESKETLQQNEQESKETLQQGVKNLDSTLIYNKEINKFYSLKEKKIEKKENFQEESEGVNWVEKEKQEMIAYLSPKTSPLVAPPPPPYFWEHCLPELQSNAFFERMNFQIKHFIEPSKRKAFVDEKIIEFEPVFRDKYENGVGDVSVAKDYFKNWVIYNLKQQNNQPYVKPNKQYHSKTGGQTAIIDRNNDDY